MPESWRTNGISCGVFVYPNSTNPPYSMIEHPASITVYEKKQAGNQTWFRISESTDTYEKRRTSTVSVAVFNNTDATKPPVSIIQPPAYIYVYEKKTVNSKQWWRISADGKTPASWVIADYKITLQEGPKQRWVPFKGSDGKELFILVDPKPKTEEVKPTTSTKENNREKTSYYYIATDWNNKAPVNQKYSSFETLSDAKMQYDSVLRREFETTPAVNNYKVYDSEGNIVYPEEQMKTLQLLSVEESELQDTINWSDVVNLYSEKKSIDSEYASSVDSLTIKNLTGVMGIPYQWLPSQDPRLNSGDKGNPGNLQSIGRTYGDKILTQVPLLLITPGVPDFMRNFTDDESSSIMTELLGKLDKNGQSDTNLQNFIKNSGKYYSLSFDYSNYYQSVNAMCRSAAHFLDIADKTVNGHKLSVYDQNASYSRSELDKFLSAYNGCIPFYIDSENSIQDSFGNDTTQSQLADTINGYSAMANEVNYITGNTKAARLLDDVGDTLTNSVENMTEYVDQLLGGANLITSIGNGLEAILNGGKLIFPEIWSDSSFSRSYDVTVKLVTPDNDKLSWYLNIWVPLAHLMGLVLPRQSTTNGYISPYIIRAFYKGLFNVDMGIITNMTVNKGGDGLWTRDGLPTSVEVTFTIKDLYNYMSLSNPGENVMNNITLLDYIGNSCGVNINEIDIVRNIQMYLMIGGYGRLKDTVNHGIFGGLDQWLTNKIQSIFGFF